MSIDEEGDDDPQLDLLDKEIDLPASVFHIWNHFKMLRAGVQSSWGIGVITYADIVNYQKLMVIKLEPWEVEAIIAMDCEYRSKAQKVSQQ